MGAHRQNYQALVAQKSLWINEKRLVETGTGSNVAERWQPVMRQRRAVTAGGDGER